VKLTPRNKLILVSVVAGIVVALLFVVLVLPQFAKLSESQKQIEEAEKQAQAASALLDQRREVKNAASVTDATLIQLNNAVPENPELPSLIIELQDVAYSTGVSLRAVVPGTPIQNEGEDYFTIPIDLETWGTWSDSLDFLQQIGGIQRQTRTVEFEALPLEETAANDAGIDLPPYYQVKITTKLEAYVIAPSTESTTEPAPAPVQ